MKIEFPGPVPADALRYFRHKVNLPGFDYRDIWRGEHAHVFTVAKAMQIDLLQSIRDALDQALAEGMTFRQFARDLTPQLQRLGWWGRGQMLDPVTGDTEIVQLGSPRRLKTIYRANMRTARAAGQWDRAQRTKEAMPYFIYELGPSLEHREEHAGWAGTLLPIDHPWWDSHMPPNGWGCKCRVRQVGRAEAERLLGSGKARGEAPVIRMVEWQNKRTGKVEMVPEGIDPGWDTNPGKTRQRNMERLLAEKLSGMDPKVAEVAMRDLAAYQKAMAA